MSIFTRLSVSQDQSRRMADKVGADLENAYDAETMSGVMELRGITLRCAACDSHAACAKLMNDNQTLDEPPEYCRNAAMFRRLQRK
ncbi:MAG: DUF6455 family protein [Paracoccaceae bacterium]